MRKTFFIFVLLFPVIANACSGPSNVLYRGPVMLLYIFGLLYLIYCLYNLYKGYKLGKKTKELIKGHDVKAIILLLIIGFIGIIVSPFFMYQFSGGLIFSFVYVFILGLIFCFSIKFVKISIYLFSGLFIVFSSLLIYSYFDSISSIREQNNLIIVNAKNDCIDKTCNQELSDLLKIGNESHKRLGIKYIEIGSDDRGLLPISCDSENVTNILIDSNGEGYKICIIDRTNEGLRCG